MGESDLQATYNGNEKNSEENLNGEVSESASSIDLFKGPVQSLLKCGNIHDALDVYISAYSSDFPDLTCLGIFVDGVVENARENLTKYVKFNVDYFLCMCGDIITDPVTLKCGHTFSKKCILSSMKTDTFDCKKCGKKHSRAYINQLKNNVTISLLIEKFWKIQNSEKKNKIGESFLNLFITLFFVFVYFICIFLFGNVFYLLELSSSLCSDPSESRSNRNIVRQ